MVPCVADYGFYCSLRLCEIEKAYQLHALIVCMEIYVARKVIRRQNSTLNDNGCVLDKHGARLRYARPDFSFRNNIVITCWCAILFLHGALRNRLFFNTFATQNG